MERLHRLQRHRGRKESGFPAHHMRADDLKSSGSIGKYLSEDVRRELMEITEVQASKAMQELECLEGNGYVPYQPTRGHTVFLAMKRTPDGSISLGKQHVTDDVTYTSTISFFAEDEDSNPSIRVNGLADDHLAKTSLSIVRQDNLGPTSITPGHIKKTYVTPDMDFCDITTPEPSVEDADQIRPFDLTRPVPGAKPSVVTIGRNMSFFPHEALEMNERMNEIMYPGGIDPLALVQQFRRDLVNLEMCGFKYFSKQLPTD